jgi:hypothetical protein
MRASVQVTDTDEFSVPLRRRRKDYKVEKEDSKVGKVLFISLSFNI